MRRLDFWKVDANRSEAMWMWFQRIPRYRELHNAILDRWVAR